MNLLRTPRQAGGDMHLKESMSGLKNIDFVTST